MARGRQVVMSDLSERAFMMQSAPFMSRPLPMMIPLQHWWEVPVFWVSVKMYDFLGGSRSVVPESHLISKVLPPSPHAHPPPTSSPLPRTNDAASGRRGPPRPQTWLQWPASQPRAPWLWAGAPLPRCCCVAIGQPPSVSELHPWVHAFLIPCVNTTP